MNILIIDPKTKNYSHNYMLHLGLWMYMQNNHNIVRLSSFKDSRFNKNYNLSSKEFCLNQKPYIEKIIIKEKIEAIVVYNSHNFITKQQFSVIKSIANIDIPKFYVCGDFFRYEADLETIDKMKVAGFSKVFFRQKKSIHPETLCLNPEWLPYSIDFEYFDKYSSDNINGKSPKVGFVGSGKIYLPRKSEDFPKNIVSKILKMAKLRNNLYSKRIKAIEFLESKGMMEQTSLNLTKDMRQRDKLYDKDYIKFLTKNMFSITCGGDCNFLVSKYFEIPASYSLLVCTHAEGLEMFPEDMYLKFNENNLDKLYDDIVSLINDKHKVEEMIFGLNKYVRENHSHSCREKYFIDKIKR